MIEIPSELKVAIVNRLVELRANFDGTDAAYARQYGISPSVYSTLKNAKKFDGLLKPVQWINLSRDLDIALNKPQWNMVRTEVFNIIEEEVLHCKAHSKSMIFVDACEIGKSFSLKYLARTLKNTFYVDCSQAKTRLLFIRTLAKSIGLVDNDTVSNLKSQIKQALRLLPNPVILLDEAGDLDYKAFLDIKELWNSTEGICGWYMSGADGLRAKIEVGMGYNKVGYEEIFSRFGRRYSQVVPREKNERQAFYKKLITDVLSANMKDRSQLPAIVQRCLVNDNRGRVGGLRRAEDLLILNEA